jgi:FG-GAP repeat
MKKLLIIVILFLSALPAFAQNVGIGNTNPTEKLEVTGNIKADTVKPAALKLTPNAGTGKILTSDAAGNAAWTQSSIVAGNVGYGLWGDCATNGSISEYLPVVDSAGKTSDNLGFSVSIFGDFAFIGIPDANIGANVDQGAVLIYKYENNGWNYFTKLTDATGAAGDEFGHSVCINGNYAFVGSYKDYVGASAEQGSASIYQYNGTNWVLMQKITDATGAAGDHFGSAVSISGNKAIVGSSLDNVGANGDQGSASFYQFNGTNWVLMQKVTDVTGATSDQFGLTVSISGTKAVIGAPYDDEGANVDNGSAIFYQFNGTSWILTQKISNGLGASGEIFGFSVAIDDNYAVVGKPGESSSEGAATTYFYGGASWSAISALSRPTSALNDQFGYSVSITGNYILVGVYSDDVGSSTDEGAAALFTRVGNLWQQQQYITDPSGSAYNYMGASVAIDGITKRFVICAPGAFSNRGKALFGKVN